MRDTKGIVFQVPERCPEESDACHENSFQTNIAQAEALTRKFIVLACFGQRRFDHLPVGSPDRHCIMSGVERFRWRNCEQYS